MATYAHRALSLDLTWRLRFLLARRQREGERVRHRPGAGVDRVRCVVSERDPSYTSYVRGTGQ